MAMIHVCYAGSWADYSGYGEANRQDIAALYIVGINLSTERITQVPEASNNGWPGSLAGSLEGRSIPYKVKIIHLTPDTYENHMEKNVYHIGRLMWETDRLPHEWIAPCNKMAEIWTASEEQAKIIKRSGVKVPVYWFPQAIDIASAESPLDTFSIRGHKGFLFYSIFQWIERKNPRTLLRAYWKTFKEDDDVTLLLKTYRLTYESKEFEKIRDDIRHWKKELPQAYYPRIALYPHVMTRREMVRLHRTGDCFVLPHHGEGWGRPLQEAVLSGNPIIATRAGGIHDYIPNDHYYPLEAEKDAVVEQRWIPYYKSYQNWWNPSEEDLMGRMREVYNKHHEAKRRAQQAQQFVRSEFNYWKVGSMMRKRLEDIVKHL